MAMIGLQADTQCGYFSGPYSNRDLNSHGSYNIWPVNNVDVIVVNGNSIINSTPPYPNQHLMYKEILRQTMIRQEHTFRHQLSELHRLHKRQRELMDEMKRSGSNRHHLQLETLQIHPFLSQNSSESSSKSFQVSSTPWLNPTRNSGTDNNVSRLTLVPGKATQEEWDPAQDGVFTKEAELSETKCKKVCKRTLDLELPADEYFDSDEEDLFAGESVPKVPVVDFHRTDDVTHSTSRIARGLVDLNEPLNLEEETDPDSDNLLDAVPGHKENLYQPMPEKTNLLQVQLEGVSCDSQTRGDALGSSNVLHDQMRFSQPFNTDETGQSICDLNSYTEVMHMKPVLVSAEDDKIKHAQERLTSDLSDESSVKSRSKRKILDVENLESDLSNNSYISEVETGPMSNQLVPLANNTEHKSSLVTSMSKQEQDFVRAPSVVQALPCFRAFVELNKRPRLKSHEASLNKSCQDKVLECYLKSDSAGLQTGIFRTDSELAFKNQDANEHGKVPGYAKSKRFKDLNITVTSHSRNKAGEKKLKDASGFSMWRKMKPACFATRKRKELTHVERTDKSGMTAVHLSVDNSYVSSGHCSSLSLPMKHHKTSSEESDSDNASDLGNHHNSSDLIVKYKYQNTSQALGMPIDFSSYIKGDEFSPSSLLEMNLEKGVASPPSIGESNEIQAGRLSESARQNQNELEELVRNAAEAIVSISSSNMQISIDASTFGLYEGGQDLLHWFARIASFAVDDPESNFGVALSCRDLDLVSGSSSCEFDYFEAMTLSLKEADIEEYCYKLSVRQEEPINTVELPSLPKCSRSRRGRQQRKDFQTEVLPILACLSRHEVSEDLYSIGLVENAHNRRGGIRKNSKIIGTRGRRGRKPTASYNTEAILHTSSNQQARQIGLEIELRKLICWGKIKRRPRGHRYPARNPRFILGQV